MHIRNDDIATEKDMNIIRVGCNLFSTIDDDMYDVLSKFKWFPDKRNFTTYTKRRKYKDGDILPRYMHQFILDASVGFQIDHIDGNGLNNTRTNLRVVTNRENAQNRHHNKTSKYSGVSYCNDAIRKKPWKSQIYISGVWVYLGHYTTEKEAHLKYIRECSKLNGVGMI